MGRGNSSGAQGIGITSKAMRTRQCESWDKYDEVDKIRINCWVNHWGMNLRQMTQ